MLLSQTRGSSPAHSKANLLSPGCGEGKYSFVVRCWYKENSCSKPPKSPKGFQQSIFKGSVREGVPECVISSCTILWLRIRLMMRWQDYVGLPCWLRWWRLRLHAAELGLIPGLEDPVEKGMTTHSGILAWKIPMDRGARWIQSMGLQRVG